jgi:hypothetical protein
MERAQGVSSGPRGPESMVMVCFIASFVKRDTIPIPKATISPKKKERKKRSHRGLFISLQIVHACSTTWVIHWSVIWPVTTQVCNSGLR